MGKSYLISWSSIRFYSCYLNTAYTHTLTFSLSHTHKGTVYYPLISSLTYSSKAFLSLASKSSSSEISILSSGSSLSSSPCSISGSSSVLIFQFSGKYMKCGGCKSLMINIQWLLVIDSYPYLWTILS